jgi:hypothetical protein
VPELLRGLGVIRETSPTPPGDRSASPLLFFTPDPERRQQGTVKRKRNIDESDGNGDVVMRPIEWKRTKTGELREVVDLTQD